jgi:hypothetical protein
MPLCNLVKDAVILLDDFPKFSPRSCFTLVVVDNIRKLLRATRHFLMEVWSRGLDQHDARRQLESRARRIFNVIMTDRCGQCLAPITLCRQAH